MAKRAIRKVTYTVFCYAGDVPLVKDALDDAFGNVDADCYGGTAKVTKATPEEEAKARPEIEAMQL